MSQSAGSVIELALTPEFTLAISPADAEDLSFLSVRTGLHVIEAQRLGLKLREAALRYSTNPEQISKWVFDHFFRELVAPKDLNDLEKQKLSYLLSSVFSSLDYRRLEIVNRTDLLAALSLLCAGSKSAKLAFGFAVYDEEGVGVLRRTDFVRYIRSLLAMLFSCTRAGREMDEWTQKGILRDITRNTWQEFSTTMHITTGVVSFEQFSQWYNSGGFEKAPWLELLDVKKWPKYKPVDAYTANQAPVRRGSATSAYSDAAVRRRTSSTSTYSAAEPVTRQWMGLTTADQNGDNEVVFRFHLDDVVIDITRETIAYVRKLVENSQLKDLALDRMYEELVAHSSNGMIDKAGFDRCTENLVAETAMSEDDKSEFMLALSTVFYGYDRTESEVVDLRELACGFSLLCAGNKSTKLAFAFDVMDSDGDGYLTRKELWTYFRSFICILLTLSGAALEMSPEDLNQASDIGAVFTCTQALSSMRGAQSISFDDIAEWYTEGGFTSAPWLELLDLSKWVCVPDSPADQKPANGPATAAATVTAVPSAPSAPSAPYPPPPPPREKPANGLPRQNSSQAAETMSRASATAGTESLAGDDTLFTFSINTNLELRITRQDAAYAQEISAATGLVELDPARWYELTAPLAAKRKITKTDYDQLFGSQLVLSKMSRTDQALVAYALGNLYAIFDYEGTSWRHAGPLLAGLSILTTGSKSAKLSVGFRLFGRGNSDFLSEQALQDLLTSYLTMLFACSFDATRDDLDHLHSSIQAKCGWVAHRVCEGATGVTFQRFGQWYNTGGFRIIPWLELLDLSKWTADAPKPEPSAPEVPVEEVPLTDAFTFALTIDSEPFYVPISSAVASKVTQMVQLLGTGNSEPAEIYGLFLEYDDDGLLAKRNYDKCMRKLRPGQGLTGDEKVMLSNFLSALFFGFDRAETEAVELVELAVGFSILCTGSKSSKLAFAFDLMDEDSDGFLTRRGLWRYLRSFLCVLLTLSEVGLGLTTEELSHACDSAALAVCAQLFQYLERRNQGSGVYAVSFDDIADWYTDGGFAAAPWLELLDVCKWQLLLQST